MSSCIQKEEVFHYLSGKMPSKEEVRIKAHLRMCEQCRVFLERERRKYSKSSGCCDKSQVDPFRTESISPQPVNHFHAAHSSVLESLKDRYTILGELSQGGQAVVYKAIQKSTQRTVVVKILPQGAHAAKRARYRFELEIEMIASLQHPNIVTVFDSGITEGKYFYAMEYIEGLSLDDYIKSNELSRKDIMVLFDEITTATAYAHRKGIIHRDLKPGNILVDIEGQPHILDFGLAKVIDSMQNSFEGSIMTSVDGELLGTLAYMSPEQAAGKSNSIDTRTDVYSIGVMLYQTLTNVFPYPISGPLLEVIKNIQEIEPEKPSKINDGIDSDIEAITLKALSKESERRYQSADELSEDIKCYLEDRPISAKSDSSIYILKKMLKKHRYVGMILMLLVIIVLGFSATSGYLYTREKNAIREMENAHDELRIEMQELVQDGNYRTYIEFLQGWHEGRIKKSVFGLMGAIEKNDTIFQAIKFLKDESKVSGKINKYLKETSKEDRWFAYFNIAEQYYKLKNYTQAEEYYLKSYRCYRDLSDEKKTESEGIFWIIKARLYEFTFKGDKPDISKPK